MRRQVCPYFLNKDAKVALEFGPKVQVKLMSTLIASSLPPRITMSKCLSWRNISGKSQFKRNFIHVEFFRKNISVERLNKSYLNVRSGWKLEGHLGAALRLKMVTPSAPQWKSGADVMHAHVAAMNEQNSLRASDSIEKLSD